jgi:hypothetical protein
VAFEFGDELRGDLRHLVGSDFLRNVQALDALYQFISDIDKQKSLENLIHRLLDASEVDCCGQGKTDTELSNFR